MPEHAKIAPLYDALSESVKSTPSGKDYGQQLDNIVAISIGKMAPDFTQYDTSGKPVKLSDFRGKKVLIVTWASW